jgi:hypothetical protein
MKIIRIDVNEIGLTYCSLYFPPNVLFGRNYLSYSYKKKLLRRSLLGYENFCILSDGRISEKHF